MKTLTVFGASDDLIETNGIDGCDEFGNYSDKDYKGYLSISLPVLSEYIEHLKIHILYDGCWSFAVAPGKTFEELPGWEIRRTWGKDIEYSETLEIDVPDNARLTYEK